MNSYIRIVTTQCSVGTWFVSGICVDTLHEGGNEDNNNNNNNNVLWVLLRQEKGLFSRTFRTYFCFVVVRMT
jgi:heme/copper-type cytochrome/quinol oxidase subunit 3